MDIPCDVLEKLKCVKCGVNLSRGPVYLQHDGAALCGRCFTPELLATRNTQYEAVAPLLRFPCKYSELGCGDTVPYVQEDEVIAHEEVCAHRHWVCPVLGSARCEWLGPRADILQHCQDRHPDSVLNNPCHLEHDITQSICVTSAKMYHSVRHLGSSDEATNFTYNLDIKCNGESISKKGQVAPQGCLAIQEDTSLVLDINNLLGMLGGLAGTSFTVEVKRRVREVVEVCVRCGVQGAAPVYRDEGSWKCERCAPTRRACINLAQGCSHRDINMKSFKHEMFFCQQRIQCCVCDAAVARGSLSTHYDSACRAVCTGSSTWRATRIGLRRFLMSGASDTALCFYRVNKAMFALCVYIPVSSEQLGEFRCVVRVTQSVTYTLDTLYDKVWDWGIEVRKDEFPSWDCVFDVNVDITKIDS